MKEEQADMTEKTPQQKPKRSARVHPDERGRIQALNAITTVLQGAPLQKTPISYYTPILIQCTLPHSDPKTDHWVKTNGDFSLIVSSGVDKNLQTYGIPYGSFPRLTLAYIITRVIQTGERRIDLASHFSGFLKEIGYTGNLRGNTTRATKSVREQLMRLLFASIRIEAQKGTGEKGLIAGEKVDVVRKYALWWDYKNPEQDSLWGSYIELSEPFYQSILSAPVPLRTEVLKALKKSPLALDTYMWVSYRLFTMRAGGQESVSLSYGRLQEQFGTGISEGNYRKFRQEFKLALAKVAQYWRDDSGKSLLNYELNTTGLTLYRSPFIIGKAKPVKSQTGAGQTATGRSLDQETLRTARQIAGQWDVTWLESQYFDWIEREGITPKNHRAHFLSFVKTHRQRHGESI